MLKKIKQYFCKHKWNSLYVYGIFSLYQCDKCDKTKNDWTLLPKHLK